MNGDCLCRLIESTDLGETWDYRGTVHSQKENPLRRALLPLLCLVLAGALLSGCSSQQARLEESLAVVCQGQAVSEAAVYTGGGPHPIVLLSSSGEHHSWSSQVDDTWLPETVSEAQLVACVGEQEEQSIEVCHYNGPDITRYVYRVSVRIVAAQTGATVATEAFVGDPPRKCRQSEDYDLTRLEGPDVSYEDISSWIGDYVANPVAQ